MSNWTLIEKINNRYGIYKCKCGKIKTVNNYHVNNLSSKSCGCHNLDMIRQRNKRDHTGEIFNNFKFLQKIDNKYKVTCLGCSTESIKTYQKRMSCWTCSRLNHHKMTDYIGREFENKVVISKQLSSNGILWGIQDKETFEIEYRKTHHVRKKLNNIVRIRHNLRARMSTILKRKGIKKLNRTIELIGCSWNELINHLQKQFKPEMSWNNYGKWHLDHIIPLTAFNLECKEEQKKANHYSNLQPLWAKENILKGNKILEENK